MVSAFTIKVMLVVTISRVLFSFCFIFQHKHPPNYKQGTVTQLSFPPSQSSACCNISFTSPILVLFQISTLKTSKLCQTKLSTQHFKLGKADLQCPGKKAFLNLLWRITSRTITPSKDERTQ